MFLLHIAIIALCIEVLTKHHKIDYLEDILERIEKGFKT